jgi:hypothetical protein
MKTQIQESSETVLESQSLPEDVFDRNIEMFNKAKNLQHLSEIEQEDFFALFPYGRTIVWDYWTGEIISDISKNPC